MNILKEAGYLYLYSKKLLQINRKIKSLSKKKHKHGEKHSKASSPTKKHKHLQKHDSAAKKIKKLLKDHESIILRIKHHKVNFSHALEKSK